MVERHHAGDCGRRRDHERSGVSEALGERDTVQRGPAFRNADSDDEGHGGSERDGAWRYVGDEDGERDPALQKASTMRLRRCGEGSGSGWRTSGLFGWTSGRGNTARSGYCRLRTGRAKRFWFRTTGQGTGTRRSACGLTWGPRRSFPRKRARLRWKTSWARTISRSGSI